MSCALKFSKSQCCVTLFEHKCLAVEASNVVAGIEIVYAPWVHYTLLCHVLKGYPVVVVGRGLALGIVGEVVEEDAVAIVAEMGIECPAVVPLCEMQLYGHVCTLGFHIACTVGRFNGYYLPQSVEVAISPEDVEKVEK